MKLVSLETKEMSEYNDKSTGKIYCIAIEISDISKRASEMNDILTDTSWLEKLDIIDKATYEARSKITIDKLVNDILNKIDDDISKDFGEYMVSDSAQTVLRDSLGHIRLPLAELIKEKVSGNPGFDFHTESHDCLVVFGEAKYSGVQSAHGKALSQINKFIKAKKDIQELADLRRFVNEAAIQQAVLGNKSFCAAFSIVSDDIDTIMNNAITSNFMESLLSHKAVYLIGVKVSV